MTPFTLKKVLDKKFHGRRKTCGETTARMGRQQQEVLLVAAERKRIEGISRECLQANY
jgi:hypothetical protein